MEENFFKKLLEDFEKLQSDHNVKADEDYDPEELESILSGAFKELDDEILKVSRTKTINFKKLHEDAIDPSYAFSGDSGFDLFSVEDVEIEAFGRALVPTGLSLEFDENYEIQIRPKSGLAINQGLTVLNTPGTVDYGYRGEIKVIIFNTNNKKVLINKGTKIAQAVLCPVMCGAYINFKNVNELSQTERGENGFGSTGLNK